MDGISNNTRPFTMTAMIPISSMRIKYFISPSFSWELKWPQEKLKTMVMQNFGVTNKEHYGMLWYFLERSIVQY